VSESVGAREGERQRKTELPTIHDTAFDCFRSGSNACTLNKVPGKSAEKLKHS
jgi:hypothetical protein